MPQDLGPIRAPRRSGEESFHEEGGALDFTVRDFWRWAYSDLLSNTTRGVVAEYLVTRSLGAADRVREPWDAYDLTTPEGVRVEVKSSADLQSWCQSRLSDIRFGIAPTRAWDPRTNQWGDEVKRQADIYVFCLLHRRDKATVDPVDVSQWTFYLLARRTLDESMGAGKQLSLKRLLELEPREVAFGELGAAVRDVSSGQAD